MGNVNQPPGTEHMPPTARTWSDDELQALIDEIKADTDAGISVNANGRMKDGSTAMHCAAAQGKDVQGRDSHSLRSTSRPSRSDIGMEGVWGRWGLKGCCGMGDNP